MRYHLFEILVDFSDCWAPLTYPRKTADLRALGSIVAEKVDRGICSRAVWETKKMEPMSLSLSSDGNRTGYDLPFQQTLEIRASRKTSDCW